MGDEARVQGQVTKRAREYEDVTRTYGVYDKIRRMSRRVGKWGELYTHPLWDEIFQKMIARQSPATIEKWLRPRLQPGEPLYDVSTDALVGRLRRMLQTIPKEAFVPLTDIERKYYHDSRLDVMNEYAGMIRYQKARIDRFAAAEEDFPLPVEQQRRELETLSEMLKQYWQAEVGLGLRPSAQSPTPQTNVDVTVVNQNRMDTLGNVGQEMAATMQQQPNAIPEVMGLLQRLRDGESEAAQTIEGDVVEVDAQS